jgi:FKBP-type peptidyl-prolyl cis-trans isomerase
MHFLFCKAYLITQKINILRTTSGIVVLSFFLFACSNSNDKVHKQEPKGLNEEVLIEANKRAIKTESEQIKDFIGRYGWDMKETGSGLLYMIYRKGEGTVAEKGMQASLKYSLRLINGHEIDDSGQSGLLEFIIGSGGVVSGLEEAILHLHHGDKAKIIIPSHLAYGLIGDQDKVPPKATLIYDIEVLRLEKTL